MKSRIDKYKERRYKRLLFRLDDSKDEEGQWITTENGHHVHISDEGVPDKGNPKVIGSMVSGRLKEIFDSSEEVYSWDLEEALLELPVGYIIEIDGKRYKRRDEEGYRFETYPEGKKLWKNEVGGKIKNTKECKIFGTEDDLDEEPIVMKYSPSEETAKKRREQKAKDKTESLKKDLSKRDFQGAAYYSLSKFPPGFMFEIGDKKFKISEEGEIVNYPGGEKAKMYEYYVPLMETETVKLLGFEDSPYETPVEIKAQEKEKPPEEKKWSPKRGFKLLHPDDSFSQERKDNAVWDTEGGAVADAVLRPVAERLWNQKGFDRHIGFYYTAHSDDINDLLRKGPANWWTDHDTAVVQENIDSLTKDIDMSEAPTDIWLQRGCSVKSLGFLFNVPKRDWGVFENGSPEEIMALITSNCEYGQDKAFMSCGSAKGKGYPKAPVILTIYCPKGTKMLYVEPFSKYGSGKASSWNGKDKQTSFSLEDETILQRGTMLVPRKVTKKDGQIYIDVDVIGQEY